MEILDEFSEPINYAEHFHRQDCIHTFVFSGDDRVHQYENDSRVNFFKIPMNLSQLALHYVKTEVDLKLLEKAASELKAASLTNLSVIGDYCIGIVHSRALSFFNDSFKSDLLVGKFSPDPISSITSTFDLSAILKDQYSVNLVTLIGMEKLPNQLQLDKDLYRSLFGLEAYKRNLQILLLSLSNGHLWYLSLSELSLPNFLYSTCDECVRLRADRAGTALKVYCRKGKVLSFEADDDSFRVEETFLSREDEITNFCSGTHEPSCSGTLIIRDRTVSIRRGMPKAEATLEEKLNRLRSSLNEMESERDSLEDLLRSRSCELKELKRMSDVTLSDSRLLFDVRFSEAFLEVRLKSTLIDLSLPFCVVLTSHSTSRTFYSSSPTLAIPAKIASKFHVLKLLLHQHGIWLSFGAVNYGPSSFKSSV